MSDDEEINVLDIIHQMYGTEREFLNAMRLLNASTRNETLMYHIRIQDRVLHILNRYLSITERRPPARVVMNIPFNLTQTPGFWDSVNVAPSAEEIDRAVERMAVPPHDTICSICQDPVAGGTRIRHCNHFFHGNCINEWFELNPRCPVCRYDIREYHAPATTETEDV